MGRTAPPGRPNTTSTPSRLIDSRTIRAPDIFMVRLAILPYIGCPYDSACSARRSRGPRVAVLPILADPGLGGGQPSGGDHERRARDVGHPRPVAELHRRRLAAVLATDPDLEVR